MFQKYQHIVRLSDPQVEGLTLGSNKSKVYVFPKLDGANCQVSLDEGGNIIAGSRRKILSSDNTNQGFYDYVVRNKQVFTNALQHFAHNFDVSPDKVIIYGEWLVKHTIKTYRDTAWRVFHVFDVVIIGDDGEKRYIPYEEYVEILKHYDIEYIPPLAISRFFNFTEIAEIAKKNTYLIDEGVGKGVVVKRYDFRNSRGKTVWAKYVLPRFKDSHSKEMVPPQSKTPIESRIVEKYQTVDLMEKEFAKLAGGWTSKKIPQFLSTMYYCLVTEELWRALKKFKNPTIDFKELHRLSQEKSKQFLAEKYLL